MHKTASTLTSSLVNQCPHALCLFLSVITLCETLTELKMNRAQFLELKSVAAAILFVTNSSNNFYINRKSENVVKLI